MKRFVHSDLAAECEVESGAKGIRVSERECEGNRILRVQVKTPEAAARIGKPMGQYVTVDCGDICRLDEQEMGRLCRVLGVEIRSMAEQMCGKRIGQSFSVLVAGLGNREMTPDAIGPEVVRRLAVTRHLERLNGALFSTARLCRISALVPGVPAQTGLETVETVKGVVRITRPDLVIAIDALSARGVERLGGTVQLSDSGICPASGVGRASRALDRASLEVPVMALGVPTVVGSDTLAWDLLRLAGVERPEAHLQELLERGSRYFVAPREIDLLVMSAGVLLAGAIERAFSIS